MKIEAGELVLGMSIGEYTIGMSKIELIKRLGDDFCERSIGNGGSIITLQNAMIWLDKNERVSQIGVTEGFYGSYKQIVRIGATLGEIKFFFGGYEYDKYTYNIAGVEGMCFELEDVAAWNELTAPIEWIFIYRVE